MHLVTTQDGTEKAKKVFATVPTEVGQTEAEEIGVEHLLRDVKDATISTLASDVSAKLAALRGLHSRLTEVARYLEAVLGGSLPVNHDIMFLLQDMFNLLPNMSVEALSHSLAVKSNDMLFVVYLASLIRSILALHKLIDNKEQRGAKEAAGQKVGAGSSGSQQRQQPAEAVQGWQRATAIGCLLLTSAGPRGCTASCTPLIRLCLAALLPRIASLCAGWQGGQERQGGQWQGG